VRRGAPYLFGLLVLVLAGGAFAEAPDRSPRPALRPSGQAQVAVEPARVILSATALAPRASLRPSARGGGAISAAVTVVPTAPPELEPLPQIERRGLFGGGNRPRTGVPTVRVIEGATALATARSLRPALRPAGLVQQVRAAATRQTPARVTQSGQRGALCGVPGLVGDRLEPIPGRIQGCGIAEPVRLRQVDGIALSTPATVNCDTAQALQTWVQRSLVPSVGRTGGGVSSLRVVASYACRTRNNQPGARVSEHGRGNAIDIAGIGLANGSELTVLTGWRDRRQGRILREVHSGACGPFGTVLGPNSDRFHQDHFHFDVASYRSGPYCR